MCVCVCWFTYLFVRLLILLYASPMARFICRSLSRSLANSPVCLFACPRACLAPSNNRLRNHAKTLVATPAKTSCGLDWNKTSTMPRNSQTPRVLHRPTLRQHVIGTLIRLCSCYASMSSACFSFVLNVQDAASSTEDSFLIRQITKRFCLIPWARRLVKLFGVQNLKSRHNLSICVVWTI
jgi:hypothetical protein